MKKLFKVLVALAIVALAAHCNGDGGDGGTNPLADQAARLQNSWGFDADNSTLVDGDWSGFELAIPFVSEIGGTFQIANAPTGFEAVWTNGGDIWGFINDADLATIPGEKVNYKKIIDGRQADIVHYEKLKKRYPNLPDPSNNVGSLQNVREKLTTIAHDFATENTLKDIKFDTIDTETRLGFKWKDGKWGKKIRTVDGEIPEEIPTEHYMEYLDGRLHNNKLALKFLLDEYNIDAKGAGYVGELFGVGAGYSKNKGMISDLLDVGNTYNKYMKESIESKNEDLITRNSDGMEITIDQVDETNLRLSFTVAVQTGRTAGIDGEWTFVFNAN